MRQLPPDYARCREQTCPLRETCVRYLSPPHERQVYLVPVMGACWCPEYREVERGPERRSEWVTRQTQF